jgi:hypothetical protein
MIPSKVRNVISTSFRKMPKLIMMTTLFTRMAMEAALWFNQKMKQFPSTQEEDFTGQIQRRAKKLLDVLSHPPAELDLNGKISAAADSGDEDNRNADG